MPRFSTLAQWLAWLETLHPKRIDMSLERIVLVLDALGVRTPSCPVITVGGTNGKGSCVAYLESIYRTAGFKVGAFTSPHLWRFNERIRVDGVDATDVELIALFEAMESVRGAIYLTYFEASVVAALLCFSRREVDVAVLEVGMGGRLDAVNAVDADVGLIASIDLDHQAWLGNDREAIGYEKAGIMRPDRPVIVGDRNPPASTLAHAAAIGAQLKLIGRDFDYSREEGSWTCRALESTLSGLPPPALTSDVQYDNAAACITAVECLQSRLPVGAGDIATGLVRTRLHGRTECHDRDGIYWVFDVAHNPGAARQLRRTLDGLPAAGRTIAVFGAMQDKDIAGVLGPIAPLISEWHVARVDDARGASAESLVSYIESAGSATCTAHVDMSAATLAAAARAALGDRVLVFGSFHTVGPAMAALGLYSPPA